MGMEIHALRGDWGNAEEFARELLVDGFTGLTDISFTCSNRIWMDAEQEDRRLFKPFRTPRDRAYWICFHCYVREYRFEEAYELIKRTNPFLRRLCESEDGRDFNLDHYFRSDISSDWGGLGIRQARMRTHFADVVTLLVFQKKFVLADALIKAIEPMYEADKRDGLDTLRRLLSIARNEQMQTDLLSVEVFVKNKMQDLIQNVQAVVSGRAADEVPDAEKEFEGTCMSSIAEAYQVEESTCSNLILDSRKRLDEFLNEEALAKLTRAFDSTINRIGEICRGQAGYKEAEKSLGNEMGELWNAIGANSRDVLVTGQFIFTSLEKLSSSGVASLDYSPVCLCWSKVVEAEFLNRYFKPLAEDFKNGIKQKRDFHHISGFLRNCYGKHLKLNEKSFTLGSFGYVFGYDASKQLFVRWDEEKNNVSQEDDGDIKYVYSILKDTGTYPAMTEGGLKEFVREVAPHMDNLAKNFRNAACHPRKEVISLDKANACRQIVFPATELLKLIVRGPTK